MKKFFKVLLWIVGILLLLVALVYSYFYIGWRGDYKDSVALLGEEAPTVEVNGQTFRDLNKNGRLDTYEDSRAGLEARIDDLIGQMNLEEKAGSLFITMQVMRNDGTPNEIPQLTNPFSLLVETNATMLAGKKMNHFNVLMVPSAEAMVKWNNDIQKMAERTRLGIPVTVASDPRHGTELNIGSAVATRFISRWPSSLGLAATRDSALVHEFGDIARQEYLALGIRLALHPMADLATDPRWARNNGTFGEDAMLSAKLTEAYIRGFQTDSLGAESVACMTKHFPGGGPQEDGWDAHFASGKNQAYPGDNFEYHLIPFTEGAFKVPSAQIMPYYGRPVGIGVEEVGFAYSKEIITDLLRDSLKYEGVICTDWALVTDMPVKEASAWGVEDLSELERVEKLINAGNDMLGGETRTDLVIQLVEEGRISEARIDESLRRIFRDKFRLGLFDDPYISPDNLDVLANDSFVQKGIDAQHKSVVLAKNDGTLPLKKGINVYLDGVEKDALEGFANVVSSPKDADIILMKFTAPQSPPKGNSFLERMFPQGRLEFNEEERTEMLELINQKPTIGIMTIGRPSVIPVINESLSGLLIDFEIEDRAMMDVIFGDFNPTGKLPLEIPSSTAAVEKQFEDVPYDSDAPLYPFGHGLSY